MKVVIDISPLKSGHQYRGIGVYTKNLYKALKNLNDGNEYLLTTKSHQTEADLVHYPFFDFFFMTLPLNKHAPTVVTIHDTIPLIYEDEYPPGFRGKQKFKIQKLSLKSVKKIITDSNQSTADVVNYLQQSEEKVSTVYIAADDKFQPQKKAKVEKVKSKYQLSKPYILYVGDINYNKNLLSLIESYSRSEIHQDLVMVSKSMANDILESQQIRARVGDLKLDERVKFLTQIPSEPIEDLVSIYSGADWYIQPSLYEGFGLPVLESWAVDTPVISSTGGSLKEVVGKAAITFDPTNMDEMTSSIRTASSCNSKKRSEWIEKGKKRASVFNWTKTAKNTVQIYEQALLDSQ